MGRDAAWLRGLVLAVIRGPILPIDSEARLIEIRNSSNQGALNPAWARACHFPRARLPEYIAERFRYWDSARVSRFSARENGGCPQGRTAPLTPWPLGTCRGQGGLGCLGSVIAVIGEPCSGLGEWLSSPEGSRRVGRDEAWLHGSVIAVIWEPWFQPGVLSVASRGLAPL